MHLGHQHRDLEIRIGAKVLVAAKKQVPFQLIPGGPENGAEVFDPMTKPQMAFYRPTRYFLSSPSY